MPYRDFCLCFIIVLSIASIGCGSKNTVKVYDCNGTVTLDGQPLDGASIAFTNTTVSSPASAKTDTSGNFRFQSQPGEFNVTVVKLEGGATKENPYAPSKNLLPSTYANAANSGLKVTVTSDKAKNVFSFDLKKN